MAEARLPDQLQRRLERILDAVIAKDIDNLFREPVSQELYPTYFELISTPMDLGTIKSRMARGYYSAEPSALFEVTTGLVSSAMRVTVGCRGSLQT